MPSVQRRPQCSRLDTVTYGDAVVAAGAGDRTLVDRKDHRVALSERHDLAFRLHARALLDQQEFAAGEIAARRAQQHRRLQRKTSSP